MRYVPGVVDRAELVAAVRKAGYDVVESCRRRRDLKMPRPPPAQAEIRHQWTRLIVGVIFTRAPLPRSAWRATSACWALGHATGSTGSSLALATPVQFYVGWDYYVGAYKSLRNGSANMDVLVAMGSSVAYFYSVAAGHRADLRHHGAGPSRLF